MRDTPLHPDIESLQIVARALGTLRRYVVFIGGATTTLYVDDPAAPASVATQDIDCVVELSNLISFQELERNLRELGFKQPVNEPNPPICRWGWGEIRVDLMPSDPRILGFSNQWYPEGIANREERILPDGTPIFVFSLPYFVASKLVAMKDRGGNDLRMSHDLEDIVLVLSGSGNTWNLLSRAPESVKNYLKREFALLLNNPLFHEAVEGALAVKSEDIARARRLVRLLQDFVKSE